MISPAIIKLARIELARRSFYDYCQLMSPDWYKDDRAYLKTICNELQDFVESDDDILIINAPPRHGKSRAATDFCPWYLGKNPGKKIMTGSYNEMLSESFSRQVRNTIDTEKVDPDVTVYRDVFPAVKIKRGDGAVTRWSLVGQHASYLATSPTGTATGFGADLLIIDDLVKSDLEANNEAVLNRHWEWFNNTMMSRLEEGGKIIIIMTRWHSKDLSGRAENHYINIGKKVRKVLFKALQDDGTMLCDEILSNNRYKILILSNSEHSAEIIAANYQQEPIDVRGRLYTSLKTYDALPPGGAVFAYIDTADEGPDYLCMIIWTIHNRECYVLDVYYTKDAMEKTERECAKRLTKYKVAKVVIESNNGGRGFSRNVDRLLRDSRNFFTTVKWFHQSKNKAARILTMSSWIIEHVYYPVDWHRSFPEYYRDMLAYQREGKNQHDDCADATTGMAELALKNRIGPVDCRM